MSPQPSFLYYGCEIQNNKPPDRLQVDSLPAEPPGKPKNTGVGSLSLLQWIFPTQKSNWVYVTNVYVCVCVYIYIYIYINLVRCSVVSNSLGPMDYSPPDSSVHGIFQARILECVTISFSRQSSWPRDPIWVSHVAGWLFTFWATREAL